eukprot:TRINITY_DN17576_c0_g1_i1.p1 TRINITY_DN17576_c0_g1~~TRINITY_DN17576_c0_g1_i1.p1  ORF type:complete len:243 (-),score=38.64 TRINITY_DN17576_c0_g1_i1:314-994(-)
MATTLLSLPSTVPGSFQCTNAVRSVTRQQCHVRSPGVITMRRDLNRTSILGRGLDSTLPQLVLGQPLRHRSLRPESKVGSAKTSTVVPAPDFRIPIVLLGTAAALVALDQKLAAAPIGLLGGLLAFQATRVRFLFTEDSLEVVIGAKAESSGENVFVGGENKWKYDTFTNWEFWWPDFPVLVYFKETQTKPEGQIHFFPIIADGKKLYEVMVERCGPSQTSGPKSD